MGTLLDCTSGNTDYMLPQTCPARHQRCGNRYSELKHIYVGCVVAPRAHCKHAHGAGKRCHTTSHPLTQTPRSSQPSAVQVTLLGHHGVHVGHVQLLFLLFIACPSSAGTRLHSSRRSRRGHDLLTQRRCGVRSATHLQRARAQCFQQCAWGGQPRSGFPMGQQAACTERCLCLLCRSLTPTLPLQHALRVTGPTVDARPAGMMWSPAQLS